MTITVWAVLIVFLIFVHLTTSVHYCRCKTLFTVVLTGVYMYNIYITIWLEVTTRLFSYRPAYQSQASITSRGVAEGTVVDRGLDTGPIRKQLCDNLFIMRLNLPIRQWINYFICHNSLLEYAESNWWMIDRLLWCLYSTGASARCNKQSETSVAAHDIWKFQTKLRSNRIARADISPGNFHL